MKNNVGAGASIAEGTAPPGALEGMVHNIRVAAIERLGLGYAAASTINPQLIYCAATGFGLLAEPGFTSDEIADLYERGVAIAQPMAGAEEPGAAHV